MCRLCPHKCVPMTHTLTKHIHMTHTLTRYSTHATCTPSSTHRTSPHGRFVLKLHVCDSRRMDSLTVQPSDPVGTPSSVYVTPFSASVALPSPVPQTKGEVKNIVIRSFFSSFMRTCLKEDLLELFISNSGILVCGAKYDWLLMLVEEWWMR